MGYLLQGLQDVINALLMYMDTDNCVCDEEGECSPDCQQCMYCTAYAALYAIGYYQSKDADETRLANE